MISFSSLSKRRGATLAGVFSLALSCVVLLCGAGSAPIENFLPQGAMQGDLNAGGHNLTNAATVYATNVVVSGSLTAPSSFTLPFSQLTSTPTTLSGYGIANAEPALGNPSANGYVLSSTAGGTRSWIAPGGGGVTWPLLSSDGNLSFGSNAGTTAWINDDGTSNFTGRMTLGDVTYPYGLMAVQAPSGFPGDQLFYFCNAAGYGVNIGAANDNNLPFIQGGLIGVSNDVPLGLESEGGDTLIGTTTDDGIHALQISGSLSFDFGAGTTDGSGNLTVNSINIGPSNPPASSSAAGTPGQIAYDSNYFYVCVATNTWKRTALSTW